MSEATTTRQQAFAARDTHVSNRVYSTRGTKYWAESIDYMTDLRMAEDPELSNLMVRESHGTLSRPEKAQLAAKRAALRAVLVELLEVQRQ